MLRSFKNLASACEPQNLDMNPKFRSISSRASSQVHLLGQFSMASVWLTKSTWNRSPAKYNSSDLLLNVLVASRSSADLNDIQTIAQKRAGSLFTEELTEQFSKRVAFYNILISQHVF